MIASSVNSVKQIGAVKMDDAPIDNSEFDLAQHDTDDSEREGKKHVPIRRNSLFYRSMRRKRHTKSQSESAPRQTDNSHKTMKRDGLQERPKELGLATKSSNSLPCWKIPTITPQHMQRSPLFSDNLGSSVPKNLGPKYWNSGETTMLPSYQESLPVLELHEVQKKNHIQRPYDNQSCNLTSNSENPLKKATGSIPAQGKLTGTETLTNDFGSCTLEEEVQSPENTGLKVTPVMNTPEDNSNRFLLASSQQNGNSPVNASITRFKNVWHFIENIELLYQEYREKSTIQEIETRRMQDCTEKDRPEFTDEAKPQEVKTDSSAPVQVISQPVKLSQGTNNLGMKLWQNLEKVRNSMVLSTLSRKEIKLQEAMFELVTSEASYYKSLEILVFHFMKSEQLSEALSPIEKHHIFSNILDIKAASERFFRDLEHRIEEDVVISDVCDIVYEHTVNHFNVYIPYVTNQSYQEAAYRRAMENNLQFRNVMAELEKDPKCRGLPFPSFLILPFQRITRLKLLVQNILKTAEEESKRESTAVKAHKELEKVIKECSERVKKMGRTEQLINFEKKLEFKIKAVPIISQSRWLLKEGELEQMSGQKATRTFRKKKLFKPVYLILFNDLFLITKKHSYGDRYEVFDYALRGLLRVQELEDQGQALANIFMLRLLENNNDREVQYMLKAKSQSDKKRWVHALAPNRRTKYVSPSSLHWDCPQVQCIQRYTAQEPDELSLEAADILNVVDCSQDGWILGDRLHDGEKGWFPSPVVEEIKNPQLRAQNRKECYRIFKAEESHGSKNKEGRKFTNRNVIHQR
ncbi:ephexin-1 isoform X1 [Stegostoma tigrinum]|uniref:ephexin-1 isoform X1 n=2 Tax=Stegostoma tigrinum TaxID=3053191 RepID=UPI00202B8758|nr:ephexin-1 isoform X1 [Stegostoma tigrinum]XP_048398657.1 ephexin-1 isoform X1 [Stegostoma tigrinum]XP_048398658.1 ephexin-1 isoform X1 [Stegostoma tigrinum]XP_048398659.1 ephexin-1 isoform X1 [Stegostoma tigrinum]